MTTHAPATYTSGCIRGRLNIRADASEVALARQEVLTPSAKQSHPNRHLPLSELQTDAAFKAYARP
jgi:hypothetical protein